MREIKEEFDKKILGGGGAAVAGGGCSWCVGNPNFINLKTSLLQLECPIYKNLRINQSQILNHGHPQSQGKKRDKESGNDQRDEYDGSGEGK